jgi:hypothetical protein
MRRGDGRDHGLDYKWTKGYTKWGCRCGRTCWFHLVLPVYYLVEIITVSIGSVSLDVGQNPVHSVFTWVFLIGQLPCSMAIRVHTGRWKAIIIQTAQGVRITEGVK